MFLLIYMNQCHLAENKVLSALNSDLCLLLGRSLLFFSLLNSICYSYLITTIHLSNIFYSCNILSSFLHLMLPLQCNTTFCFILVLIERKESYKKLSRSLQLMQDCCNSICPGPFRCIKCVRKTK